MTLKEIRTMSDSDLNIEIHKRICFERGPLSNYANDLNAIHAVEMVFPASQWDAYARAIKIITRIPNDSRCIIPALILTARQRAEALLYALTEEEP
jgi:hypothetical protein